MADTKASTTTPSPAKRFHANLLDLCDLIIETVRWVRDQGITTSLNPDTLAIVKIVVGTWKPDETTESFISKSYNYWEQIRHRDKRFLIENAGVLFAELPGDTVKAFSELINMQRQTSVLKEGKLVTVLEDVIPAETLTSIWELVHSMVRISIRYIHEKRAPTVVVMEVEKVIDGVKKSVKESSLRYTVECFGTISIRKQVELWNVTL